MSKLDADSPQAMHNVKPLTDKQRQKVREFFDANPRGGYKRALKHAGIKATRDAAKAAIEDDDELFDIRATRLGVTDGDALAAVGEIIANPDHKDRLRAAEAALKMLHGYGEKNALELSGPDRGPVAVEDRSASLADVLAVLKATGAVDTDE